MMLRAQFEKIDGRPYGHYRDLRGHSFGLPPLEDATLHFDHVQGDPFAAPSRLTVDLPAALTALPAEALAGPDARRACADFLQRRVRAVLAGSGRRQGRGPGSGKSGMLEVAASGPQVLERTAARVAANGSVELRVSVGLPAAGRRILGRAAAELVCAQLPSLLAGVFEQLDHELLRRQVSSVEDQVALRGQLAGAGLVAFLADGSVLPRSSGADSSPLQGGLPLRVPDALAVELPTPHSGALRGLAIREGVTLIVGGGYHGKSTLLQALALGVYDHAIGDGRERCVTRADAVALRAEDGRSVRGVDLRAFIGNLPLGRSTECFDSDDASGSTSQAAATIEALEAGASAFLIDEDTAATNFMIRDARMRLLVPDAQEPITPYLDRVRQLWEQCGVSSVLVVGGAGDYLDVADQVIQMDAYVPRDLRERAAIVARELPLGAAAPHPPGPLEPTAPRRPDPKSLDPRRGRRAERVRSLSTRSIEFGREEIDVSSLYQLVDSAQCRAIGDLLLEISRGLGDGVCSIAEILDELDARIASRGLVDCCAPGFGDRARPRRYEIVGALNRLRSLRLSP